MTITRLIKYPGAKNLLIPEISKRFGESGADTLVDVFGGSGNVSLNVNAPKTVYNELNKELVNLFMVIKTHPKEFLEIARKWTVKESQFLNYKENLVLTNPANQSKFDRAFRTFYKFNVSFGGMGSTYRTQKEKSSLTNVRKILSKYDHIKAKISNWKIENLDFKELIRNYGGENVFFYCDPPYTGKSWYDYSFNINDLEDLKKLTRVIRGNYLFTFDYTDENVMSVFGEPSSLMEFKSQNKTRSGQTSTRKYSIYHSRSINLTK